MIKFDEAKPRLKRDLNDLKNDEMIVLECFKKDRSVTIKKINDEFIVNESGYIKKQEQFKDYQECVKYVIKRINFQFPNSKNLWYHKRKID